MTLTHWYLLLASLSLLLALVGMWTPPRHQRREFWVKGIGLSITAILLVSVAVQIGKAL